MTDMRAKFRSFLSLFALNAEVIACSPAFRARVAATLPPQRSELSALLPIAERQELKDQLSGAPISFLLLDASLPADWHRHPWEQMRLFGASLSEHMIVVRKARALFGAQRRHETPRPAALLNLFPADEFNFLQALNEPVQQQKLESLPPRHVSTRGLGYAELLICAHADKQGLLSGDKPYELPPQSLPKRVWLMACNKGRAMDDLAERLLANGVSSVVTGRAELSAVQMSEVMVMWLQRPPTQSFESWWVDLLAARCSIPGGRGELGLYGDLTLDDSECTALWNERWWQEGRAPEQPPLPLRDAVATGRLSFDAAYKAFFDPGLWPRVKLNLGPELISAAEGKDHKRMRDLACEHPHEHSDARVCHALAIHDYRLGRYEHCTQKLQKGLAMDDVADETHAELLGALVNVALDLVWLEAAQAAIDQHKAIALSTTAWCDAQEFKQLDWESRLALRRGDFEYALHKQRCKRNQRMPDDARGRELAWIVYALAWQQRCEPVDRQSLPSELHDLLNLLRAASADAPEDGNDTRAYGLRALACWRWVAGANVDIDAELHRWMPCTRAGLEVQDPGPWAFTCLFLSLARPEDSTLQGLIRFAKDALESKGYWLELAGFARLQGDADTEARALQRFSQTRARALANLDSWARQHDVARSNLASNAHHMPM